jgi:ATP-dependent Clp protease protease subunit
MDLRLQKLQITYGRTELDPIILHISSPGGYVAPALAAMDTIKDLKSPVHTIIEGECCSAATFLSLVGFRRYIRKHAYMLIHQIESGMWGKYKYLKDEVANLEMLMGMTKDIYKQYTKIPDSLIEQILERDLYLKSSLCLKNGLVDEIINEIIPIQ